MITTLEPETGAVGIDHHEVGEHHRGRDHAQDGG